MHTRALKTYLLEGLFTLQKRLKGMVFFNINGNACILIHPISTNNFLGNHVKIPYFPYPTFSLMIFFLGAKLSSIFFLHCPVTTVS